MPDITGKVRIDAVKHITLAGSLAPIEARDKSIRLDQINVSVGLSDDTAKYSETSLDFVVLHNVVANIRRI